MKAIYLSFIFLISFSQISTAQIHLVPLNQKIENSELIVEGKVLSSHPFFDQNSNSVFTEHEIRIQKILKGGVVEETVTIITMGGVTENFSTIYSHLLSLAEGDEGLFFLIPTKRPTYSGKAYEVYSSSQGFLKYHLDKGLNIIASEIFNSYEDVDKTLFSYIEQKTGQEIVYKKGYSPHGLTGIRYSFQNLNLINQDSVAFDLYINGLYGNYELFSVGALIQYDTDFFGDSIVASNRLQVTDGTIASNANNTLSTIDTDSNSVAISLTASNTTNLSIIDNTEKLLAHFEIAIEDIFADPNIVYDPAYMAELSRYYSQSAGGYFAFDTIVVEGDLTALKAINPQIDDFFPDTVAAGRDTITIVGSNFGSSRGESVVQFTNAQKGPTFPTEWIDAIEGDYVFWSSDTIRVLVPTVAIDPDPILSKNIAGTGTIRVRRGATNDNIGESMDDLYVQFAAQNKDVTQFVGQNPSVPILKSIPTIHRALNSEGGYEFYYGSNFKNDIQAVEAFERALVRWRCATGIRFIIKDSIDISNLVRAGRIEYAPLPTGNESALGRTEEFIYTTCADLSGGLAIFTAGSIRQLTIKFNSLVNWHKDTLMPPTLPPNTFDLESTALHELGHAHLLQHSNNVNDLMFFENQNGTPYRRVIQPNDLLGGIYIASISSALNAPNVECPDPMSLVNASDCDDFTTSTRDVVQETELFNIYPNPAKEVININTSNDMNIEHLIVYNAIGQVLFTKKTLFQSNNKINITSLQEGIYYLTIITEDSHRYTKKFIKQ